MKNVTRIPSSNDSGRVGTLLMHKKFKSFEVNKILKR